MSFRKSLDSDKSSLLDAVAAKKVQAKITQERVKADGDIYGNKSANLLELQRFVENFRQKNPNIKVQIPEICPLSHDAIQEHLDKYSPEWRVLWQDFVRVQGKNTNLVPDAQEILSNIRDLIQITFDTFPIEISDEYLQLMNEYSSDLMVRSTGKEDDVLSANPGGNESVAAVKPNVTSISNAIGIVIASYFSEKSLRQRLLSPPPANDITQEPFMPVLLQRMIGEPVVKHEDKSQKRPLESLVYSGVMYTGEKNLTVQLAPGHGELIVNSKAPFDTYFISREDVIYSAIYQKKYRLAPEEEDKKRKLVFVENPHNLQNTSSVSSEKAKEIAELGREIEKNYGMPMDVELVYSPKEDTIYLVQARPIPEGDRHKFRPSSFPPDQALALKQNPTNETVKSAVIAPAASAAKVVTKNNEILICETIEETLIQYLAQKDSKVKACIVANMAPSTSHEAAQFNAKAIPVLQVEDLEQVKEWMINDKPVLIVDPQRSQIVKWTEKIIEHDRAEEELFTNKILEFGQFRSPLPPEVTPADKFDFEKTIKPTFKNKFFNDVMNKKNNITWNNEKVYSELQHQIDILEAAKTDDKNILANQALLTIQFYIFKLAINNKNDALFQHATIFCADIKKCLDRYSVLEDETNAGEIRSELLDLISKLTAIITNPGKALLISDSIYQRIQHQKEKIIAKELMIDEKLSETQFSYFQELVKLRKLILNSKLQHKWDQFVLKCCQNRQYFHLLIRAIHMMTDYKIQSDILNVTFAASIEKSFDTKEILLSLDKECSETENRLKALNIEPKKMLIQSWERRTGEWSLPNNFEKLYREFQRDIIPLIDSLTIEKDTPGMTKKSILKTVQDLTEMMDKTIKSLKSSPDYESDEQKKLQVERFAKLLNHYHALMNKWMMMVNEEEYLARESSMADKYKMGKLPRIAAIQAAFDALKDSKDVSQLNSSGNFSVASGRLGSSACFRQQFVGRKVTLEDLFSLMHQNIIASTIVLAKETQISVSSLPAQIQPLIQSLTTIEIYGNKVDLLNIENNYPRIHLEYNLPLRTHAAKIFIDYDSVKQTVAIKFDLYSVNLNGRMNRICDLATTEGKIFELLGLRVKQSPTYNEASACFEFTWEMKASQVSTLASLLQSAITQYAKNTFNSYKEVWSTILSFLKTPSEMSELIYMAELMADKINFKDPKYLQLQPLFTRLLSRFNGVTLESSNYLRIAKLFMTQFSFVSRQTASAEQDASLNEILDLALSNAYLAVNDPAVGVLAREYIDQIEALKNGPVTTLADILYVLDKILLKEKLWKKEDGAVYSTLPSGLDILRKQLIKADEKAVNEIKAFVSSEIVKLENISENIVHQIYQGLLSIDTDLGKCKENLESILANTNILENGEMFDNYPFS